MKRALSTIMAICMVLSLCFSVGAESTTNPLVLNDTNFTLEKQGGDATLQDETFTFGTNAIPRLVTKDFSEKDFDIQFDLTASGGNDWKMMLFFRDQDPGKASWESRAANSGYLLLFGNGAIALKNGDMSANAVAEGGEYAVNYADGQKHTVRLAVKDVETGVSIKVYYDGGTTPVIDVVDTTKAVTAAGKLSFLPHAISGFHGTITAMQTVEEEAEPAASLDKTMGVVDLMQAENTKYIQYGQGAKMENGKIVLPGPINARYFLEKTDAKDMTVTTDVQFTNPSVVESDWLAMFMLRDQMPGAASWERGAETATNAAYMVIIYPHVISVKFVNSFNAGGIALNNNEYTVPSSFDWTAKHSFELGTAEVGGVTTVSAKLDGTTIINAADPKARITEAGGFTFAVHSDKATLQGEVTALKADLTDKSTLTPEIPDKTVLTASDSNITISEDSITFAKKMTIKEARASLTAETGVELAFVSASGEKITDETLSVKTVAVIQLLKDGEVVNSYSVSATFEEDENITEDEKDKTPITETGEAIAYLPFMLCAAAGAIMAMIRKRGKAE